MLKSAPLALALIALSVAAASAEPVVKHAGEWETTIDNGHPLVFCSPTDVTLDQNYLLQSMAKIPGANCAMSDLKTSGNVTSYSIQCTIGGSQMTSSGTMTVLGPDSYSSKVHSHGGAIKMPNGQTVAMPDTDMTVASHRVGPCKPGDRQLPH